MIMTVRISPTFPQDGFCFVVWVPNVNYPDFSDSEIYIDIHIPEINCCQLISIFSVTYKSPSIFINRVNHQK